MYNCKLQYVNWNYIIIMCLLAHDILKHVDCHDAYLNYYQYILICHVTLLIAPKPTARALSSLGSRVVRRPFSIPPSVPASVVNFSHVRRILWTHGTGFDETWKEARTPRPLSSLCFFRADRVFKMVTLPLIGSEIFDISFATAERNLTKLDRKQEPSVLSTVMQ